MESHENEVGDFGINSNGMTLFMEFQSTQEALGMRDVYHLDGHEIRLWHKGRLTCVACGEKGHKEDRHDGI